MSEREQIAQVALDKWATMSDSLRSLRGNEQFAQKILAIKSKILFYYALFNPNPPDGGA